MSQPVQLKNPFVGRASEQKAYQQLLVQDSPWLLVITGDGGIGKSRLLRHLAGKTPRDIPAVLLNFANDKLRIDPLNILAELSWQLAAHCDEKRVPAFERVLAEGRDKLSAAIKAINQQFIAGEGASVTCVQQDLSGYSAATMREQRRQVRESVTHAFYQQLMTFQPPRLALLLDTCEWLSELEGLEVGKWVMDELLPAIHDRLAHTRRRLSAVIAGRVPPPLTVIEGQDRWPLSLPRLDAESVNLYLQQIGMNEDAMRRRVYEITRGHALCVSIIGTLWQEQGDHPFTLADLPDLRARFTERALVEYIRVRLSERLKPPYSDLTRYGVLLRSFDLPMLQAVFPELLSGADALTIFHRLTAYPYVERRGNSHYAFHDLLREIQAAEVRAQQPAQWMMYHRRALDYLSQQNPRPADWYYHAIACDEAQGMDEWWEAVQAPRHNGTTYLAALFEAAYDVTLELSPTQSAHRVFKLGRFYSSAYGIKMDDAVDCYKEALSLYRQVGSKLGEANVLQAMGDVQQFRDEREAALASYEQALGLFRQVGDRLGEANVLQAMGDVQQFRKDMQAALASYEQALGLYRQVGSKLGEANVRKAMGDVQQFRKDMQVALASYEQALGLFRQVGSKLGEANVLQAMGDVQQFRKDMQAALASYEQALGLFRQVGDRLGEANVLQAMGDVQQFRKDMQAALASYEQALGLFRQVGDRLGEANVLQAMGDVQQFRKDMQAALASYEQALGLYRQVGDRLGEANVLQAMGDVQQFRKDMQVALASYEQALGLFRQVGSRLGEANVLRAMGDVQRLQNELEAALASYEQALGLYRQVGDRLGEANCYRDQGRVALKQDNYQHALELQNNAYQLYQQIGDRYSQAVLLEYRSYVYDAMHQSEMAIYDIELALSIAFSIDLPWVDELKTRLGTLRKQS